MQLFRLKGSKLFSNVSCVLSLCDSENHRERRGRDGEVELWSSIGSSISDVAGCHGGFISETLLRVTDLVVVTGALSHSVWQW